MILQKMTSFTNMIDILVLHKTTEKLVTSQETYASNVAVFL